MGRRRGWARFAIVLALLCPGAFAAEALTPAAVEAWADALFEGAEQDRALSAAAVVWVQDGRIAFAEGYGPADRETGAPLDPARHRLRIGSITKTFTATALGLLIEEGRIASLDDPANDYLERIRLPDPGGQPITLRQLATHSAGFDSRLFGLYTDRALPLPLAVDVIERLAAEPINPPGSVTAYNNFGTGVLALLVEDVTGEPIAEFVARRILAPLGMDDTALRMGPPPPAGLATSYGYLPDGSLLPFVDHSFHPLLAPTGGIDATATDMGRYLLAQLGAGPPGVRDLLAPETRALLHTRGSGAHPLATGFGVMFFTWDWNGEHLALHGGDLPGWHSGLLLLPERNAGLFFTLLADWPEVPLTESLFGSERMTPAADPPPPPITNAGVLVDFLTHFLGPVATPTGPPPTTPLSAYEGTYVGQNGAFRSMEKLLLLANDLGRVRVEAAPGGGLTIAGRGPYRPAGEDVFVAEGVRTPLDGFFLDSPFYLFLRDDAGAIRGLTTQVGFDTWLRVPFWRDPMVHGALWAIALLVAATGLLAPLWPPPGASPVARSLPALVAVTALSAPCVLLLPGPDGTLFDALFFARTGRFTLFALLCNLTPLLGLALLATLIRGGPATTPGGRLARAHHALVAGAGIALLPPLVYFRVLAPLA